MEDILFSTIFFDTEYEKYGHTAVFYVVSRFTFAGKPLTLSGTHAFRRVTNICKSRKFERVRFSKTYG